MPKPLYQQVRERFRLGPANHMTHMENFGGILCDEGLHSYNQMRGRSYHNLANKDVQKGRAGIAVKATDRRLHDYVPLYFGFKTPMVAWNQNKNPDLIFLRISLNVLALPGVVISDGNARATATKFRLFKQIDDLSVLDIKSIHTVKYAHDPEMKRRKQAEILIPDFLPLSEILDIICYSEEMKKRVLGILAQHGRTKQVYVRPGWYFRSTERASAS